MFSLNLDWVILEVGKLIMQATVPHRDSPERSELEGRKERRVVRARGGKDTRGTVEPRWGSYEPSQEVESERRGL